MRSYSSDVEVLEIWCADRCILPFPAEIDAACRFIEDEGRVKAPATVRLRLCTIRKVHRLLRLPDPTQDEDINLSLRRVRRSKVVRPKQAKGLTRPITTA
jgi:integrase/recombinase XerD